MAVVFRDASGAPGFSGTAANYELHFPDNMPAASVFFTDAQTSMGDFWATKRNFETFPRLYPQAHNPYPPTFFLFFQNCIDVAIMQFWHPQVKPFLWLFVVAVDHGTLTLIINMS